jgi:polyhydroxyalkanoate synthesis regulator phasin
MVQKLNKLQRTGILLGVGAALLTKEAIEKYVRAFAKKNKLTIGESKKLTGKLVGAGQKNAKTLHKVVKQTIDRQLKASMKLARQGVDLLDKRLTELEKKIRK